MTVQEYIDCYFPESIIENKEDIGNRFGLPYPYTVPSPGDVFDCMFYWDTHFTNVGLIASGNIQQAIYNTDNIRAMILRFGYMPNSTKAHHLGQSQPPFYFKMVSDIFYVTADISWLDSHYDTIAKEYDFWMTNRLAPNGLNYYGRYESVYEPEELERRFSYCKSRFSGFDTDDIMLKTDAVNTVRTLCESGWDCCYRFEMDGHSYNPVDLNALLYALETQMAAFSVILGRGEETLWQTRADQRKAKMDKFLYSTDLGFYLDWNYKTNKHSPMISAASLFPLYLGLNHNADKIMDILEKQMLLPFGVTGSVLSEHGYQLQWEYPNVWAPLQYVAFCACRNAGREDLALEIAKRYIHLLENNFNSTGKLWEKYDGLTGEVVNSEYQAPPMMGWTAGVYLFLKNSMNE